MELFAGPFRELFQGLDAVLRSGVRSLLLVGVGLIAGWFGIGANELGSLEEIGGVLGVTRERVRQIESRGLQRLLRRQRSLKLTSLKLDDSAAAAAR